jgi:hypothetical protein
VAGAPRVAALALYVPAAVDRQVAAGLIPREAADELVSHIMVVYQLNLWNAMHYALQPRFPGFGRSGRAITSDLLVWVPGKRNLQIVVECDGFTFHSTREAFTSDRRRDRIFQRHGYRVLRYSGHEIHADPIETSFELFDALHAIAGPKKYHTLNAGDQKVRPGVR